MHGAYNVKKKVQTELIMCVCKTCEDTFKIEYTFVICVYL